MLSSRTKQVDAGCAPLWLGPEGTDFRKVIERLRYDQFQFGDEKFLNGNPDQSEESAFRNKSRAPRKEARLIFETVDY